MQAARVSKRMREAIHRVSQILHSPLTAIIAGILVCVGVAAFALWYSSAGLFPAFPFVDNTYIDLGEAFLHGQLSMLEEPNPKLIALQNPYDPAQRTAPYHWDASYYKGKYYLYWGPIPALGFAAVEGLIHVRPPGSLIAMFCFIGLSVVFFVILLQIWSRFFPSAPAFSVAIFILLGFMNLPFLFLLGRPVIYETSIIAGQLFLFLGLLSWMFYILNAGKSVWLVMASLSWGLAIGSRYNLVISVAVYLILILIKIMREARGDQIRRIVSLLAPITLCIAALGAYNFARFGNSFETGFNYQLSIPEAHGDHYSISYLSSNFFIYLFYPMTTAQKFPFVISTLSFGKQFDEIAAGLFPSTPGAWLTALVVPLFILEKARVLPRLEISLNESFKRFVWMVMLAGLGQFLFLLVFFYDAMRYIADFYLPLTFGLAILTWHTDDYLQHVPPLRAVFWLVVIGLVFWTTGIGFFGSFDIPSQIFRSSNPVLYAHLASYWNDRYADLMTLLKIFGIRGIF
jgi:hypothetical protein